jgi:bifunctional non-homologous end joining protein LigD
MGLTKYKQKRSFSKTPEPSGDKKVKSGKQLLFVVQKHHASHLHYDFRLEIKGVLKSWAVPKGPSMNPADKRLAMLVEDHPFDYKDFEGIIPKGNYGAGTVIVWDEGTYEPMEFKGSIEEQQKQLLKDLHKGSMKITLKGKKLKGSFALVATKGRAENAWLLIKKNDQYALDSDITLKDKSVVSGKTIEQVKKNKGSREWESNRDSKGELKKKSKAKKTVARLNNKILLEKGKLNQEKKINGQLLKFSNLDKIYWPKEKITKRDMLNYYYQVAPLMLPYMKDRPQSLNRHPDGINGESFYQKNVAGSIPGWLATHDYKNTSKEGSKKFLVCTNEASLLYMANLGCIEINPWHSRVTSPDKPDWCVIDLDPDTNPFSQVIETAQVIRQLLESLDIISFIKTSGSTGLHIYIPLAAKYDYEQSKTLAELVVTLAHRELEGFTSLERTPAKRKGKIYLDYLQNRPIQTIAAPYSLRPKPGATVSAPLEWDEVKKGLDLKDFTLYNMIQRVKETGDLFKGVLGKGIDLAKVLSKLESL